MKRVLLAVPVLVLAGCAANNGPSSHEVKAAVAKKLVDMALAVGSEMHQVDSMDPYLAQSPKVQKEFAEYQEMKSDPKKYQHKFESAIHDVSCTKAAASKYHCSIEMENKNGTKATKVVIMSRYGKVWKAAFA